MALLNVLDPRNAQENETESWTLRRFETGVYATELMGLLTIVFGATIGSDLLISVALGSWLMLEILIRATIRSFTYVVNGTACWQTFNYGLQVITVDVITDENDGCVCLLKGFGSLSYGHGSLICSNDDSATHPFLIK